MALAWCVTGVVLAAGAMGAEAGAKPAATGNDRVQAVIEEVEKACLEGPVYMIGRKKALYLAELVRKAKPDTVVECGTALGYSGLWITRELWAAGKGHLVTIEISPETAKKAEANFRKAGLSDYVTIKVGDARQVVKEIKGPIDFLFIDCDAPNYYPCLQGLERELGPGATIVADNVGISEGGMKDYLKAVRGKYRSRTEWFDLDLPWAKRDAMEISVVPGGPGVLPTNEGR